MAHNGTRVPIYLDDTHLALLDEQRGPTSRSAWIRHLIATHDNEHRPVEHHPECNSRCVGNSHYLLSEGPTAVAEPSTNLRHPELPHTHPKTAAHKFKKYRDSTKCEVCGQREEWASPYCAG
jgi:hypothetical protein